MPSYKNKQSQAADFSNQVQFDSLSASQQGNLRFFEDALRSRWRLGQNICLCWCPKHDGILLLMVPHYFLSYFSESLNDCRPTDRLEALNGSFIRKLISGPRMMDETDFYGTVNRFELDPTFIQLPAPVLSDEATLTAIEELVLRHSISYEESRAVLLFDIVDFSLQSPFEQASQLNSLSYSLNSAYNKMLQTDVNINFARTTTGDGFYIWNREKGPLANVYLFHFMLLVIADNAIARGMATGNTVPVIRTGFHIGSHYEFYQSEGINPTMFSYIVGDVTIELSRILECAQPGQIYVGDFKTRLPTSLSESAYMIEVDSIRFVERAMRFNDLHGIEIAGEETVAIHTYLTGDPGSSGGESVRRFRIMDKHGRSHYAYNLRLNIYRKADRPIILGMQGSKLSKPHHNQHNGNLSRDIKVTSNTAQRGAKLRTRLPDPVT